MRLGVFTPLLSQLPLEKVLAKLKALQIDTVELATGNYPGDAHCKLSMLDDESALKRFRQTLGRKRHIDQCSKLPRKSIASRSCPSRKGPGDKS